MQTRVRHLKKGDKVVALSGIKKGSSGKVLEVKQSTAMCKVEGFGLVKRHTKPTQTAPKGGIIEKNRWLPACKFQVCDEAGKRLGRVGFQTEKGGEKVRIFSLSRKTKK